MSLPVIQGDRLNSEDKPLHDSFRPSVRHLLNGTGVWPLTRARIKNAVVFSLYVFTHAVSAALLHLTV